STTDYSYIFGIGMGLEFLLGAPVVVEVETHPDAEDVAVVGGAPHHDDLRAGALDAHLPRRVLGEAGAAEGGRRRVHDGRALGVGVHALGLTVARRHPVGAQAVAVDVPGAHDAGRIVRNVAGIVGGEHLVRAAARRAARAGRTARTRRT